MAKTAKGKRPVYFEDPQVDKLLAMVIALTGEVSGHALQKCGIGNNVIPSPRLIG
jgi:hypothetical protein